MDRTGRTAITRPGQLLTKAVNVVVGREAAHEVSTREEGDLVLVKQ